MAEHPKHQTEPSKTHDLVRPGSTIDPKKGQAAAPPVTGQQGKDGLVGEVQVSNFGQRQPDETDEERMRREDPLFIEKTRPEDPSGRAGQLTRDNVNPNIPSAKAEVGVVNPGGIVDPTSLGMEQGGKAPIVPHVVQEGEVPVLPDGVVSPRIESINEPPGSNVYGKTMPDGVGGGGEGEDVPPVLEELEPDEAVVGSADVMLHVHGSGFIPASVIQFGPDNDLQTAFISETELNAQIKPSEWEDGVVAVRVKNADGGLKSEEMEFEFIPAEAPASRQSKRTKPKKTKKGR